VVKDPLYVHSPKGGYIELTPQIYQDIESDRAAL
jgi:hypothetical protein